MPSVEQISDAVFYTASLDIFVVFGALASLANGWFSEFQVRNRYKTRGEPIPSKYLTYLGHGGVRGLFFIVNPMAAVILLRYGTQWTENVEFPTELNAAIAAMLLYWSWVNDPVPSAMVNGGPTMAGIANMFSMFFAFKVLVSYYLFTNYLDHVDHEYIWPNTLLLMVFLWLGLWQPARKVHGKAHWRARLSMIGGCVVLAFLAMRLDSIR